MIVLVVYSINNLFYIHIYNKAFNTVLNYYFRKLLITFGTCLLLILKRLLNKQEASSLLLLLASYLGLYPLSGVITLLCKECSLMATRAITRCVVDTNASLIFPILFFIY